jgi:osmoprotectant transport system substrate-binding protein
VIPRPSSNRMACHALAVGAFVGMVVASGCADGDDDAAATVAADGVRVASFDFGESIVLAELYAQTIESTGTPVVRLGAVGPREVTFPALELDVIDVVPEYLGTALERVGAPAPNPDTDDALADLDTRLEPLGLTALDAAPAEDKNVIVMATDTADELGVNAISELGPFAGELRFGGPPECPDRPLCLVGLRETYGLEFAEFVSQRSQRFTAEALRRGEIDVGLMFSTDPALATPDLVVLDDDRRLQPAENVVPVVRRSALARWGPDVATELDRVSAALTTVELQSLNARLAAEEPVEAIAADWLTAQGLAATAPSPPDVTATSTPETSG